MFKRLLNEYVGKVYSTQDYFHQYTNNLGEPTWWALQDTRKGITIGVLDLASWGTSK